MKKLTVIAVSLAFLVNAMGYFFIFRYQQYMVKKEMMAEIRGGGFHPGLVVLRIVNPETDRHFNRLERNEFSWYGHLYDVVVERKSGNTTVFYCLRDKKEESLLADFSMYIRANGHSPSPVKNNPIPALLYNLISQALVQYPVLHGQEQGITIHYPEFTSKIFPVYLVRYAPPPEMA